MGFVKKYFAAGVVILSAAFIAMPGDVSAAAASKSAKKRPVAVQKAKSTAKSSAKSSRSLKSRKVKVARVVRERPSFGQLAGLRGTPDELDLKSSVALVLDQDTDEVLFSKNSDAVLPIASITKLMTAMVVTDANLPLDEVLTITQDDVDTEKGSRSRLRVGTQLTREEMLHLALMASENRAAHALGRHYPGGLPKFVEAMNAKARLLGMFDTHYVEPTGLSSKNQSSARDLATLVKAAYEVELIRKLSTSPEHVVDIGDRPLQFRNTNGLVHNSTWEIGLQKTGYISAAGRCLVMQAVVDGQRVIVVLLDSVGKYSRIGDAQRIRDWLQSAKATGVEQASKAAIASF